MKKMIMGLMMLGVMGIQGSVFANEYVPDVDRISSKNEYVIVDEGSSENAIPMWISHNPSCYTKQVLKTGVWEAWIDTDSEVVHVWKDGKEVKQIKL